MRVIRKMRMRMRTRFMKVFRLFRWKKYGIAIGPPIESKPKKLPISQNVSPSKLQEELNIVEERDDEDEKEALLVQFPRELTENIWEEIVYEFILLHCDSIIRVHSFLQMIVVRKRYQKMKAASKII